MDEKDITIRDLKTELAKWRGRATDLDLCRYCRMEKIRQEAGHG